MPPLACSPAAKKKRKGGRNQSHTEIATDFLQSDTQYLPVSSTAATKDGGSYEEWELERGKRGSVEGVGEPLINEKKCIVPVSWADENRQDKVQGRLLGTLLQRAAMHKMHISGERNGGKQVGMANQYILDHVPDTVFICRSVSLCSLIKKKTAPELQHV